MITFGLDHANLEMRKGSLGASDTRIIVNGEDEAIEALWRLRRGELNLDLTDEIYPTFGNFVEGFTRHWFEKRTGQDVMKVGEIVTNPEYPGLHVTLDGWLAALPPLEFANPGDFFFSWGCAKPAKPMPIPVEFKWRNARQFDAVGQVETFMPQLHQAMAISRSSHAILATMTSDLSLYARVVPFDQFYWAECVARIESFQNAVATGEQPQKFPKLKPAEGAQVVQTILRSVDMMKTPKANLWAAFGQMMLATAPTQPEKDKAKDHEKAKTQLKAMIDKDCGTATGGGITAKRNKAGAISFEIDEAALEAARATAAPAA